MFTLVVHLLSYRLRHFGKLLISNTSDMDWTVLDGCYLRVRDGLVIAIINTRVCGVCEMIVFWRVLYECFRQIFLSYIVLKLCEEYEKSLFFFQVAFT